MKFNVIVAICENRGFGANGSLPWKLKSEMEHFTNMTKKCTKDKINGVLMGRKTWDSIPKKFKPLPGRINIVVSSTLKDERTDVIVAKSFSEALSKAEEINKIENLWVIGGVGVFKEAIKSPLCDKIYQTEIFKKFDCDVFLPELPPYFSRITDDSIPQGIQEENGITYEIQVYQNQN